jgi:hypothetical protein
MEDAMGGICSTHVKQEKCIQNFSRITKRENNLSINGKYKTLMGVKEIAYRCMNRIRVMLKIRSSGCIFVRSN